MRALIQQLLILLGLLIALPASLTAGGPENVLVVVNADLPGSCAVANHFIHLRKIPASNVVYLTGVPEKINCRFEDFKKKILEPVIAAVNERRLGDQIDYIVYSSGFPTSVTNKPHVDLVKAQVENFNPAMFRTRASINSATYFFREFMTDDPSYLSMNSNWYASRIVRNLLDTPFVGQTGEQFKNAINRYDQGNFQIASRNLAKIVKDHPNQVVARYHLARSLAQEGKTDAALKELYLCVESGWRFGDFTRNDDAFSALADNERFAKILETADQKVFGQVPTRGFTNQSVWGPNGWRNGDPSQGKRYVLSTVLAVTSGRGNSIDEAIEQLQRSIAADGTMPQGKFVFAKTGDVRSKTRVGQFPLAIRELQQLGFEAEQITADLPKNEPAILGATLGRANLNWPSSGSQFVPGAICDNLTSNGGLMITNGTQTPCTHFLANGAGGASGTVIEPLAIANKFPSASLHVHYVRGCTLAEAYYQSVQSPSQLLIVGDPLCRPWGKFPEFTVEGIEDGQIVKNDLSLKFEATANSPGISRYEVFLDGLKGGPIPMDKPLKIGARNLTDGYHEFRVVAVDDTAIGTKSSQVFGFTVDRGGDAVSMEVIGSGTYQFSRTIRVKAQATRGDSIAIFQNSRKVAEINGTEGEVSIDCKLLGLGPNTLRAISVMEGKPISSEPVLIQIER